MYMKHTITHAHLRTVRLVLLMAWMVMTLGNDLLAQTQFGPGAQTASYTDTRVRGYHFTAPTNFNICQIYVDNAMNSNIWHVEVVKFTSGAPPAYPGTTNNFVSLFYADSVTGTNPISCNIPVTSGDIIGIYGSRSGTGNNMANSYDGTAPTTTVLGNSFTLYRSGMQFPLNNQQMHDIWSEVNYNTGRIFGFYGCCPTPPAPQGPITGDTTVCLGDTVTFWIPWDSNAISYEWSVPAGDSILSGQGDSMIVVVIGPNSTGGQICVAMEDTCTTGPDTCISYSINQPAAPPSVSGAPQVCQNNSTWYTTSAAAGVTGYTWYLPPGASFLSTQDSSAIHVQFGSASGKVCVQVSDTCAVSDTTCMYVTVSAQPSLANAGPDKAICTGHQATLAATAPSIGAGVWSIVNAPGPGSFSDSTDNNSLYTTTAPGQHLLKWTTSSAGCPNSSDLMIVTVNITPTANFTTQNVCAGAPVGFQDQSSGNGATITSWLWDMDGDGVDNHITQNPIHNYNNSGIYNVRLIVNAQGCSDTLYKNVFVNPRPNLNISVADRCFEQGVEFDNNSTISMGVIDSVFWNFGDGSGLQGSGLPFLNMSPIYFYSQPGVYNISHTAVSDSGCVSSTQLSVEVYHLPTASFDVLNSCQYQTTSFEDLSTVIGAAIDRWSWSFGDGSDSVYTQDAEHDYELNGFVPVSLRVWSDEGCYDDTIVQVEIFPTPVTDFNFSNKVCLGETLYLEETATIDYGTVDEFYWNVADSFDYVGKEASHLFDEIGVYTVTLTTVSNEGCESSETKEVPVYDVPVAHFTYTNACKDEEIAFRDSSSIREGAISFFTWNFDDGQTSPIQYPVHSFDTHGVYEVQLRVETAKGCVDSVSYPVNVYERVSPQFTVSPDSGCSPLYVEFADSTKSYTGRDLLYVWDYGDGYYREDTANYIYVNTSGKPKAFDVTLRIYSDQGCESSFTFDSAVWVLPQPVASFENAPELSNLTTADPMVQFKNTSQQANWYVWKFGDGERSNEQNPAHEYKREGSYEVMLAARNVYQCVDTLRKLAIVSHANIPFIPNAFSPNGDGRNETFFVEGLQDVVKFEMFIYDRWGNQIFYQEGLDAFWDGRNIQSRLVQQGTYTYKIMYADKRGEDFELIGHVSVLGIE
jgi:gliding motility-associated-like protein